MPGLFQRLLEAGGSCVVFQLLGPKRWHAWQKQFGIKPRSFFGSDTSWYHPYHSNHWPEGSDQANNLSVVNPP